MGFPKPYPTEWPDPADYPDVPITPGDFPPPELPDEEPDDDNTIEPLPEYEHFYAVTWAVNHACNLKCTHCYDVVSYSRRDLSTEKALALIEHLAKAGVTFIAFSGGEAFLRKDIFTLMEHAVAQGMSFGARSNGTRITPLVAKRLRELGISVVGVSFDGATSTTHDFVRGQGAFNETVAGLRALRAEGIRAQMEVVLSRHNLHEALKFIELGEKLGASEVNFSTMAPQGLARERMSDLLDYPTWLEATKTLREASKQRSLPVTPNCALTGRCVANLEPHITCDGYMTPCYLSSHKLFSILDTPAEHISQYLLKSRSQFLDICGRAAWTKPGNNFPAYMPGKANTP
jgi:MoaA/NifB/PqqE/SkfB family radical SAM enzyme